jgi:hypothetical protein
MLRVIRSEAGEERESVLRLDQKSSDPKQEKNAKAFFDRPSAFFSSLGLESPQHSPVSSLKRFEKRKFFQTSSALSIKDEAGRRAFGSSPLSGLIALEKKKLFLDRQKTLK